MPLPSTHRWILVGSLAIRNDRRAGPNAPAFTLDEIIAAANQRIQDGDHCREYGNNSRIMWCSNIETRSDYFCFLIDLGDKNTSGVSFLNFDTLESRDIEKNDNEGGHYSAHVILRKRPDAFGRHTILIEKVPGLHFSSLKDHLGWICRDDRFKKTYNDDDGNEKNTHPIMEIDGFQSKTIKDALQTGQLQDIEFIGHQESFDDGLDEDPIINEVVHNAKWDVKRQVTEEQAQRLFGRISGFFDNFRNGRQNGQVFVRIKTNSGQIKRTEINVDSDSILEQAFVQNEIISDFATPLTPRYQQLRQDIIDKMLAILNNLST